MASAKCASAPKDHEANMGSVRCAVGVHMMRMSIFFVVYEPSQNHRRHRVLACSLANQHGVLCSTMTFLRNSSQVPTIRKLNYVLYT